MNHNANDEHLQAIKLGDEWANSITHGLGTILSFLGLVFLIWTPWTNNQFDKLLILTAYAFSAILLYLTSTIYHSLRKPHLKQLLRKFDHCAIYIYIAGCYTPFTLLLMNDTEGWILFSIVWGMAAIGIIHKLFFIHLFKHLSVVFYLSMGWLVVFSLDSLFGKLHVHGIYLLFAGGFFYSLGVVFYVMDKRKFFHAIWHVFGLVGSACHYFVILFYI